jgi:hypothetical protein
VAALVACGTIVVETLVGSDLGEPPQHEPDMIDLQKLEIVSHSQRLIWICITVVQDAPLRAGEVARD